MQQLTTVPSQVLEAFGLTVSSPLKRLEGGHINDTFLARCVQGDFIIQRVNRYVFPSPENIMDNIEAVTAFLREKILWRGGDPQRETLTLLKTTDGKVFFRDQEEDYWRCTLFISGATAYETSDDPAMLQEAGRAFGEFQSMLSDYPAATLHEIIPNFHNTPSRFQNLLDAAGQDVKGRLSRVEAELHFAREREQKCALLMDLLKAGKLPLRVTHNDTKMSNVLMDDATGRAVCVIDLDTVMPGLTAFDFGDSIRAAASTAAEDEKDLSKVRFDLSAFRAYAEGFLSAAGSALTPEELHTLPDGAILMTFEVGIRFLEDYLRGDVYFRTAYPEHNLDRARNQFKLVREMEQARPEMEKLCVL